MVLLGAGASIEAGVPAAVEMTRVLGQRLVEHGNTQEQKVFRFVLGGLLFARGSRGDDPLAGLDVEELLSALGLLAERHDIEGAAFINAWHPLVESLDRPRGFNPNAARLGQAVLDLVADEGGNQTGGIGHLVPQSSDQQIDQQIATFVNRALQGGRPQTLGPGNVGRVIRESVAKMITDRFRSLKRPRGVAASGLGAHFLKAVEEASRSGDGSTYRQLQRRLTAELVKVAWIEEEAKVEYLSPLLALAETQGYLSVATLNYDNTIELLCQSKGVQLDQCVDPTSNSWVGATGTRGIRLLKLHGSIDWVLTNPEEQSQRMRSAQQLRLLSPKEVLSGGFQPAVIFGGRNKLTAAGPFLDLLGAFREELEKAERLTVVGYSFRDDHVNEYIRRWLNSRPTTQLRVVDPRGNDLRVPFLAELRALGSAAMEIVPEQASSGLRAIEAQLPPALVS